MQLLNRGAFGSGLDRLAIDQGKHEGPKPVEVDAMPNGIWRISNGLLADLSDQGLLQLRDAQGVEQLSDHCSSVDSPIGGSLGCLDLAEDHREHPLPVECSSGLEFLETGPLLTHAALRYRIGLSASGLICASGLIAPGSK